MPALKTNNTQEQKKKVLLSRRKEHMVKTPRGCRWLQQVEVGNGKVRNAQTHRLEGNGEGLIIKL